MANMHIPPGIVTQSPFRNATPTIGLHSQRLDIGQLSIEITKLNALESKRVMPDQLSHLARHFTVVRSQPHSNSVFSRGIALLEKHIEKSTPSVLALLGSLASEKRVEDAMELLFKSDDTPSKIQHYLSRLSHAEMEGVIMGNDTNAWNPIDFVRKIQYLNSRGATVDLGKIAVDHLGALINARAQLGAMQIKGEVTIPSTSVRAECVNRYLLELILRHDINHKTLIPPIISYMETHNLPITEKNQQLYARRFK